MPGLFRVSRIESSSFYKHNFDGKKFRARLVEMRTIELEPIDRTAAALVFHTLYPGALDRFTVGATFAVTRLGDGSIEFEAT